MTRLTKYQPIFIEMSLGERQERDIRHMATSLLVSQTPEDLKKMKYPADLEQVMRVDQISQEKIENFRKVAKIMNQKKIRKLEQKFLDQTKDGTLAGKVMTLPPVDNRRVRQEREGQPGNRTGPSQAEIEELKSYEAKKTGNNL